MSDYQPLKASTFNIARFVLEAKSAFAISTGMGEAGFDNLLVRDANGLPTIPGTSLAGVIRSSFTAAINSHTNNDNSTEKVINDLFGHIVPRSDSGSPSRLQFSYAYLHNSHNRPIEGLLSLDNINADPLLKLLATPHPQTRERVAIDAKGVAENNKKYDVTTVPAGCRFSVEISLYSMPDGASKSRAGASGENGREESGHGGAEHNIDGGSTDDSNHHGNSWQQILALLQKPIKLGSSTRSGLGLFEVIQLHHGQFDLRNQDDYAKFAALGLSMENTQGLQSLQLNTALPPAHQIRLPLKAEDFWRIGQGNTPMSNQSVDAIPMSDTLITWPNGQASLNPAQLLAPGASIKGPLRHRTLFHLHKIILNNTNNEAKAESTSGQNSAAQQTPQQALDTLFGFAGNTENGTPTGQAGALSFHDIYLPKRSRETYAVLTHNSINRFSGGVRNQVLYSEELLWQDPFELLITIDPQRWNSAKTLLARQAFIEALRDLCEGRLAIGAGDAKGHGYCQATPSIYQPILKALENEY